MLVHTVKSSAFASSSCPVKEPSRTFYRLTDRLSGATHERYRMASNRWEEGMPVVRTLLIYFSSRRA